MDCFQLVAFVLFLEVCSIDGSNILIIHPLYTGSHVVALQSFGDFMMSRGHNVTVIRFQNVADAQVKSNITVVGLKLKSKHGYCSNYVNSDGVVDIRKDLSSTLWRSSGSLSMASRDLLMCSSEFCESLLGDEELFKTLKDGNFDVALVDLALNLCGVAYAHALELPIATFWVCRFSSFETLFTPMLNWPSIVPGSSSGLPAEMSFLQRMENAIEMIGIKICEDYSLHFLQKTINEYFPDITPLRDIMREGIGMHFNVHNHLTTDPLLTLPNIFYIGGPHLREPKSLSVVRRH